jgi:flavin reductase (DIM6/NTAB) family NADH-FMN oxidoreductase RutF
MNRIEIPAEKLQVRSHELWLKRWFLLTSGDFSTGHYNTMTVAWGSLGTMWNRPFAQVVVRPTRYTHEFMERYDSFTLCSFPAEYQEALRHLGSRSGRDSDKIASSGLVPEASTLVAAPAFLEADLILECRRIYAHDMDRGAFLDPDIERHYPEKDYHRITWGEILRIRGTEDWATD